MKKYVPRLECWIYGTIEKCQQGESWSDAWCKTYRELGGESEENGKKSCRMKAAEALYEFGRIKDSGRPFKDCSDVSELWTGTLGRNGTYAILATRLLAEKWYPSTAELWKDIREAVKREVGDKPAVNENGGAAVPYKLWCIGLILVR